MAISQEEFESLDPEKHKIIDCRGNDWYVQEKRDDGVVLVSPGNTPGFFQWIGETIIDSFGIDVTINHPLARVASL
jgi:hypothetical protein